MNGTENGTPTQENEMKTETTQTLYGYDAIDAARKHDAITLCKYADPIEDARTGLTVEEAEEVAAEDASLIYAEVPWRVDDEWGYPYSDESESEPCDCGVSRPDRATAADGGHSPDCASRS